MNDVKRSTVDEFLHHNCLEESIWSISYECIWHFDSIPRVFLRFYLTCFSVQLSLFYPLPSGRLCWIAYYCTFEVFRVVTVSPPASWAGESMSLFWFDGGLLLLSSLSIDPEYSMLSLLYIDFERPSSLPAFDVLCLWKILDHRTFYFVVPSWPGHTSDSASSKNLVLTYRAEIKSWIVSSALFLDCLISTQLQSIPDFSDFVYYNIFRPIYYRGHIHLAFCNDAMHMKHLKMGQLMRAITASTLFNPNLFKNTYLSATFVHSMLPTCQRLKGNHANRIFPLLPAPFITARRMIPQYTDSSSWLALRPSFVGFAGFQFNCI